MGDLRYALRALRRDWGFALTFVLTLGLGIGANTAIFSVVNGVLLRPLPYPDAERIVRVTQPSRAQGIDINFSFLEIDDLRSQVQSLDRIVEYGDWAFNVLGRGEPHRVGAGMVTASFFEVLGMRPLHGRLLTEEDRVRGAPPVVVLSHEYWRNSFGADPGVVGQMLDLTESTATIVGVLAPGAHYATSRDLALYANYSVNEHYSGASMQDERSHRMTEVLARLAPGVEIDAARAEVEQVATRLQASYPDDYPAELLIGIELTPWREFLVRDARSTLLILLGTAFAVLLIACANVANLTLTRLVRRDRELAVRRALGATAGRLRRLLFVESLVLAVAGAGVGLVIAVLGLDVLTAYAARFTARTGEIGIDLTVLLFGLLTATGLALVFGLVPSAGGERRLAESLSAGGGHATAGRQRRFLQRLLVVGQFAVCFILLVGAGLLLRTLGNLYAVDPGFDLANVLSLESPKFGEYSIESERQFADDVTARIGALPGVASAAMVGAAPLGDVGALPLQFRTETTGPDAAVAPVLTVFQPVTPDYFRTVGVEILRGRAFTAADDESAEFVTVLSERMATHYFGQQDPIGQRIAYSWGGPYSDWFKIIGVAADARLTALRDEAVHAAYFSFGQEFPGPTVLVRAQNEAAGLTPQIVRTIRELDAERPIENVRTLAEVRDQQVAAERLNATLFGVFAALALAIALVGIAGVLAFSVSQRTREMGIRQALGADRGRVLDLILREGAVLTLAGVAGGFVGALYVARFLSSMLYGVRAFDALTFVLVTFVLLGCGILGAWLPARRAAAVDPIDALRSE